LAALEPYISYENETELREDAAGMMNAEALIGHFQLMEVDGRVKLQLEKPDGEALNVAVSFVDPSVAKTGLAEGLQLTVPLYRSRPRVFYWHEYLGDSQTLFISYNRCANDSKLRFGDFAQQVLADVDTHPVKRVVRLASRRKSLWPVSVLIGPSTFSSAVINAVELKRALLAKFVGEPSGGMPGGYGEVSRLTLPNPWFRAARKLWRPMWPRRSSSQTFWRAATQV
jgi:hypothetical protein